MIDDSRLPWLRELKIQVSDLKLETHWRPTFLETLKSLPQASANDRLKNNYLKLEETWATYDAFTVCIQNHTLVAFSGLSSHFPTPASRALTRTFYLPEIRGENLRSRKLPSLATGLMLPRQVERALALGRKTIFVSMQEPKRRDYFEKIFNELNRYWFKGRWEILPGLYNTCPPLSDGSLNPDRSCWQTIALLNLKNGSAFQSSDFDFPSLSLPEFQARFAGLETGSRTS